MYICPHCHKEVDELLEEFNQPKGCVCEPIEWGDPDNIPPICHSFKPMFDEPTQCENCEHLLECHSNK